MARTVKQARIMWLIHAVKRLLALGCLNPIVGRMTDPVRALQSKGETHHCNIVKAGTVAPPPLIVNH
jgi:hypothetical protein